MRLQAAQAANVVGVGVVVYSHNWIFIQRKKGRASEIFRPRAATRRAAEKHALPDVINKLLRAPARAKRVAHEEKMRVAN